MIRFGSRRPKNGQLSPSAVGAKNLERISQFKKGPRKDFEIAPRSLVCLELLDRFLHLGIQIIGVRCPDLVEGFVGRLRPGMFVFPDGFVGQRD